MKNNAMLFLLSVLMGSSMIASVPTAAGKDDKAHDEFTLSQITHNAESYTFRAGISHPSAGSAESLLKQTYENAGKAFKMLKKYYEDNERLKNQLKSSTAVAPQPAIDPKDVKKSGETAVPSMATIVASSSSTPANSTYAEAATAQVQRFIENNSVHVHRKYTLKEMVQISKSLRQIKKNL